VDEVVAALPPIGLTAADPFAGGKVSRVASRIRSPGSFTCTRCPAGTAALDAVPEGYHNPAAVWWGAFAASMVIRDQADKIVGTPSQRCTMAIAVGRTGPASGCDQRVTHGRGYICHRDRRGWCGKTTRCGAD